MRDDEVVGSTKKVSKDKMKMMDVGSNKEIISSKSNSISSPDHAELAFIKKRKRIGDSGRFEYILVGFMTRKFNVEFLGKE